MIQQELKSLVHLRHRQNKCLYVRNKSIFAIFQKCKFTHPHTYMLLTVTSGILYISIPHLHRQMLNVNEKQTGKPVENRVKGTGVERKCSLTYSITEYYLT